LLLSLLLLLLLLMLLQLLAVPLRQTARCAS